MPRNPATPDSTTVERLVSGQMDAADAPPGFRLVAGLLQEAGSIPAARVSADDETTVSAMVAAIASEGAAGSPAGNPGRRGSRRLAKVLAAATFATLASGGVAAASGDLPDPIQDVVSNAAGVVGVDIPRGNAYGHLDKDERDAVKDADKADRVEARKEKQSSQPDEGQGADISGVAHDPDLEGADKGACVSGAASGGQSQAGEQSEATCPSGAEVPSGGVDPADQGGKPADQGEKPAETPAGSGHGDSVANDRSNGASGAKAGNRGAPEELPRGGRP